jgi:hypothetical protein
MPNITVSTKKEDPLETHLVPNWIAATRLDTFQPLLFKNRR